MEFSGGERMRGLLNRVIVSSILALVSSCSPTNLTHTGPDETDAATECSANAASFTGCVKQCGETSESVATAAQCVAGKYQCPVGTVAAALCPASAWPSGRFQGCGPWVSGYNCGACAAQCVNQSWNCADCGDASP